MLGWAALHAWFRPAGHASSRPGAHPCGSMSANPQPAQAKAEASVHKERQLAGQERQRAHLEATIQRAEKAARDVSGRIRTAGSCMLMAVPSSSVRNIAGAWDTGAIPFSPAGGRRQAAAAGCQPQEED